MRIISQDGTIDVSYEQVILRTQDNYIFYQSDVCGASPTNVLAKYSTEAKAKKAMEMLHNAYKVYVIYKTSSAQEKALLIAGQSEKETKNMCGVFKFPADDDVED